MTFRIAVSSKVEDARARNILQTLKGLFPKAGLRSVRAAAAYTIDSNLSKAELERAASRTPSSRRTLSTTYRLPKISRSLSK